jgi:APA family basic amino acid/polyamine antiporter
MSVLDTKPVEESLADTSDEKHGLRRALGPFDLMVFGVGVTIGAGIFVLTGEAAGVSAGPAVAISFVISAVVCGLAALCYAEFASTVPVAGSAYTFSYASLGELVAWIIGWDLILELALGASTVASGWSTYFVDVMKSAGWTVPTWAYADHHNIIGAAIVLILTAILCFGIKVSARVNAVAVLIKVAIVLLVIVAGVFYIKTRNYHPFVPPSGSKPAPGGEASSSLLQDWGLGTGTFGFGGIVSAAALVFFAFIGFDVVATAAEETKKPQRNLPIGIFGSLAIVTVLYVGVSVVVTGMVKFNQIKVDAPLASAFRAVGNDPMAVIVDVGALIGLTTVVMILLLGQTRVFFAMSRDKLLPPAFSALNSSTKAPVRVTVTTGVLAAAVTALVPLTELGKLVNIGTLFAFVVVALGVLVLRKTQPGLKRAFRTPLVPLVPILSVLASLYLMLNLSAATWYRFFAWMGIGLVIYAGYSYRHSKLRRAEPAAPVPASETRETVGAGRF